MANKIGQLFSPSSSYDEKQPNELGKDTVNIVPESKDAKNGAPSTANPSIQPADKTITPAYNKKLSDDTRFIQNIRDIMVSPDTKKKKRKPK